MDAKWELSDAQTMTGNGKVGFSVGSTNVINLGTGYDEWDNTKYNGIGEGGDLWLTIRVATAIQPGASTFKFILQSAATAAAAVLSQSAHELGSWTYTTSTGGAKEVAGKTLVRAKLPAMNDATTYLQYLGLLYHVTATTVASAPTAGAFDAWISLDSESELPSA